ncbi:hypothetical protein BCJMU07_p315 (plasmid) [Bacillus cereus]|nr:hypothetical protein BCJMU07_p315 [Bacillus cereus]BCD32879.1 hypothetical protein BC30102_p308 [Bacillus cereus]
MLVNLRYKGINNRGFAEWIESDLGEVMEEWQLDQYKPFVGSLQECIGRQLTKNELRTVFWLSGYEEYLITNIVGIVNAAYDHGKNTK